MAGNVMSALGESHFVCEEVMPKYDLSVPVTINIPCHDLEALSQMLKNRGLTIEAFLLELLKKPLKYAHREATDVGRIERPWRP
jgi:hypothetical protein